MNWDARISTFVGRQKEMEELEKWALTPGFISVAWITGKAGMGKSRLAAEFASYMTEVYQWASGLVDLSKPNTFELGEKGLLIIIDHPEDNKERIRAFLQGLAEADRRAEKKKEKKIRVLFISRHKFGVWPSIIFEAGAESLTHPFPVELRDFSFEAANEIYFSALFKASELGGKPDPSTNGSAREAWFQNSGKNRRPQYAIAAGSLQGAFPRGKSTQTGRQKNY